MTVALRRTTIQKEKLREIIFENPDSIQPDLRFFDRNLSMGECGVIDFLGVDATGRLVITNVDTEENAEMLVSALSQLQWMQRYEGIMSRLLNGTNVDRNNPPGVLLIAPAFSDKLKDAAQQVPGVDMKLIAFEYFITDNNDAIMFEEVFHSKHFENDGSSRKRKSPEIGNESHSDPPCQSKKILPAYKHVSLTSEEIGEFIDYSKDLKRDKAE